jgi:hypothetical protein
MRLYRVYEPPHDSEAGRIEYVSSALVLPVLLVVS